jgi:hypothetical protein
MTYAFDVTSPIPSRLQLLPARQTAAIKFYEPSARASGPCIYRCVDFGRGAANRLPVRVDASTDVHITANSGIDRRQASGVRRPAFVVARINFPEVRAIIGNRGNDVVEF